MPVGEQHVVIMNSLLREQQALIGYFFDELDIEAVSAFALELASCEGVSFLSGVGKSGFICKKISASLSSIGIRSNFLDPVGALHGDVGAIRAGDVVVLFSKSGATDELLRLVPVIRQKKAKVISITCGRKNALSKLSDMHIYLPFQKELCCFDMAPVTSTVLQLTFGDVVTAFLIKQLELSKDKFAMNHPAGSIGRKLTFCVEHIMVDGDGLPACHKDVPLSDALVEMSRCGLGCVIINDNRGSMCGIFTDGDLRRAFNSGDCHLSTPVAGLMTTTVRVVERGVKLITAKDLFYEPTSISVLPVVEHVRGSMEVVGIISLGSTIKALE